MPPRTRRAARTGAWPRQRAGVTARSRDRAGWSWRHLLARSSLGFLQAHVFPGRREVELRAQADARLFDSRADAVQSSRLENAAEHDPLIHQALDLVQERLALFPVALLRLLPEQIVDVGIAAGRVGGAADSEILDARRGGARRRRDRDEDALPGAGPPRFHEGRALHAADPSADADRGEIVRDALAHGDERRQRRDLAG